METFDNSVPLDIEGMAPSVFKNWVSGCHNEVASASAGGISKPARTMLKFALDLYTKNAAIVREVANLETSRGGENKLTDAKKTELLVMLRDDYEISRKMFNFAIINASVNINFKII